MNSIEKMEMADRILEILESGKMISLAWDSRTKTTTAAIAGSGFSRFGHLEAVRACVDFLRDLGGNPSIAETAGALEEADAKHAASPIVETGPDAHCACGSKAPLVGFRSIKVDVDWQMGIMRPVDNVEDITPKSGEIFACPDCGKHYKFKP